MSDENNKNCLDLIPNSPNQPHKNCMQTVRGTTKEILGVKGLKHHGTHKKQGLFQDLPGPRLIFPRHKNFILNCLIPKISKSILLTAYAHFLQCKFSKLYCLI